MKASRVMVKVELLKSLVDEDPCRYDHNHSCQTHGYFYLEQGTLCPQQELKQILKDAGAPDHEPQ